MLLTAGHEGNTLTIVEVFKVYSFPTTVVTEAVAPLIAVPFLLSCSVTTPAVSVLRTTSATIK